MFQERYSKVIKSCHLFKLPPFLKHVTVETVICRIYYEAKCATGHMTLSHFRKSKFTEMIKNLGPNVDLNNVCVLIFLFIKKHKQRN